jgi:hypothetical protein
MTSYWGKKREKLTMVNYGDGYNYWGTTSMDPLTYENAWNSITNYK